MQESQIAEGLMLMVAGMGVVFSFLALLVLSMSAMSAFFRRFAHWFPEEAPAQENTSDHADIALAVAVAHSQTKE